MGHVYAVIQNGVVVNVIVADAPFVTANYHGAVRVDTLAQMPGIGWTYSNGSFAPPQ